VGPPAAASPSGGGASGIRAVSAVSVSCRRGQVLRAWGRLGGLHFWGSDGLWVLFSDEGGSGGNVMVKRDAEMRFDLFICLVCALFMLHSVGEFVQWWWILMDSE
jgi:hypothetical protein